MQAEAEGFSGYRRKVRIRPAPGRSSAEMADDFHHFTVEVEHADSVVTAVRTKAERVPWSICPAAGLMLERMVGASLAEAAALEDPRQHCTHQFDLFALAAAHAGDTEPTAYDLTVSDPVDGVSRLVCERNGRTLLDLTLQGSLVLAPAELAGRDLRKLSRWIGELPEAEREPMLIVRRAVMVAGGRVHPFDDIEFASDLAAMSGACFTFQPQRSAEARKTPDPHRDFSKNPEDLLRERPQ